MMGYFLTREQMEEVCQTMRTQADIKICAPKLMRGRVRQTGGALW